MSSTAPCVRQMEANSAPEASHWPFKANVGSYVEGPLWVAEKRAGNAARTAKTRNHPGHRFNIVVEKGLIFEAPLPFPPLPVPL